MKITKQMLKQLISEELGQVINELGPQDVGKQGPVTMRLVKLERLLRMAQRAFPSACPGGDAPPEQHEEYERGVQRAEDLYHEAGVNALEVIEYIYKNHPGI